MASQLEVSIGQYSTPGEKETNQDCHGAIIPAPRLVDSKGIAAALADGISSSDVSQVASQTAVKAFLEDYYCTPDAWSVKKSAVRVLSATNSWLYAQTRHSEFRYDQDRGYVCTFSGLIFKSATAHLFHLGDSRVYRYRQGQLERLTRDHRVSVSREEDFLTRAMGFGPDVEIDADTIALQEGDQFLFVTDGVYEFLRPNALVELLDAPLALDEVCEAIVDAALRSGSRDNLTAQIVRVDKLPEQTLEELYQSLTEVPFPTNLTAGESFDGYRILREIYVSHRSHVYLALDEPTQTKVALKIPSVDMRDDPEYLERFVSEEWIARRISNPHVARGWLADRQRHFLYTVIEYLGGQTLAQWMRDHEPQPLETVRDMLAQIGQGLQAFHRLEMLHQDLRPDNLIIDADGTIKIIDFGSTRVAGLVENASPIQPNPRAGTHQYMAPEVLLGEPGTTASDIYSLGVIAYQLLTGELPYGAKMAQARTKLAQYRVAYQSAMRPDRELPSWVDETLRKSLHPSPNHRYWEISEFLYDLRHPRREFLQTPPLIERDPATFWKRVSLVLALTIAALLSWIALQVR